MEGNVACSVVPVLVKGRSMKRWSMFTEWVTEPSLIKEIREIVAASGVSMLRVVPGSASAVAVVIVGRVAGVPSLLNRYGG